MKRSITTQKASVCVKRKRERERPFEPKEKDHKAAKEQFSWKMQINFIIEEEHTPIFNYFPYLFIR